MIKQYFFGAVIGLALGSSAYAAPPETNEVFYNRCKPIMPITGGEYCLSPFEALISMADDQGRADQVCFPEDHQSIEAMNAFLSAYLAWVEKHPDKLQEKYFKGINDALSEAYPCKTAE